MKITCQTIYRVVQKNVPLINMKVAARGYTLIEILMVMSIFSIGILAIMTLHITAIKSNANARDIMMGTIQLTDQFEKLISTDYESALLNPGTTTSRVENKYRVEHIVASTVIPNIKKIDIAVFLDAPFGRSLKVTYYKRNPD